MKISITIILAIFLVGTISAIEIKAGDCSSIEFPNANPVQVEFTRNSSNMNGFEWNKSGTTIVYCFPLNYRPDNMTIRWFNSEEIFVSEGNTQGGEGGIPYTKKTPIVNVTKNKTKIQEEKNETTNEIPNEINSKTSRNILLKIVGIILVCIAIVIIMKNIVRKV